MSEHRVVCKASDVAPGAVIRVEIEGLPALAVYNLAGTYYVTDDVCTHGQASLAEGYIEGKEIECPWHSGRFDIASGTPTCFPAAEPITIYPVTVVGDDVCIGA